MRYLLLALLCTSCLATSGDLERVAVDMAEQISVVARSAEESAEAARDAFKRGEITYTELQARLQDIRSATLDVARDTTEQVVGGVVKAIKERPEAALTSASEASRTFVPGPWGEVLAVLLAGGASYAASTRKAKEEAAKINQARDMARMMRGEPTGQGGKT
jgi:hypothetical protein